MVLGKVSASVLAFGGGGQHFDNYGEMGYKFESHEVLEMTRHEYVRVKLDKLLHELIDHCPAIYACNGGRIYKFVVMGDPNLCCSQC